MNLEKMNIHRKVSRARTGNPSGKIPIDIANLSGTEYLPG